MPRSSKTADLGSSEVQSPSLSCAVKPDYSLISFPNAKPGGFRALLPSLLSTDPVFQPGVPGGAVLAALRCLSIAAMEWDQSRGDWCDRHSSHCPVPAPHPERDNSSQTKGLEHCCAIHGHRCHPWHCVTSFCHFHSSWSGPFLQELCLWPPGFPPVHPSLSAASPAQTGLPGKEESRDCNQ